MAHDRHDAHGHDEHGHDLPAPGAHAHPSEPGADTGHAHRPEPPVPNPPGEAPLHAAHLDVPAAPEPRSISPARADYVRAASGPGLLWPAFWALVAAALFFLYRDPASRGPVVTDPHGHGEAPAH
jgi:hypothetical protein